MKIEGRIASMEDSPIEIPHKEKKQFFRKLEDDGKNVME